MSKFDYTFVFNDILSSKTSVKLIDHSKGDNKKFSISVNDEQLLHTKSSKIPSAIADLVDITVAINAADWMSKQKKDKYNKIHVVLPVRNLTVLSRTKIIKQLSNILYWYTGNKWSFEFSKRKARGRITEYKSLSYMPYTSNEIALWSGGLDSLAGLYNRMSNQSGNKYTLLGTGLSNPVRGKQRKVANLVSSQFSNQAKLIQIPINLHNNKHIKKNSSPRARGFVFCAMGVVCAYLEGLNKIHIYENGIGAINLPFRASEVGLDHSRAVNPISLLRMGRFISELLGESFTFHNPFLFKTKAQMCEIFDSSHSQKIAFETVTCDSKHRKKKLPMQCGYCSSCILRRQAFAACKIQDQTKYVITEVDQVKKSYSNHLKAMLIQVDSFRSALNSDDPWRCLCRRYIELSDIVNITASQENMTANEMRQSLLNMFQSYTDEWERVKHIVGYKLLDYTQQ